MGIIPSIPEDAKQTNCWKFAFILNTVLMIAAIISSSVSGVWESVFAYIVDFIIWWIVMYHMAYVRTQVTDDMIEITMGPHSWLCFGWFCSSKVAKGEIHSIVRKQRVFCYDIFPRFYCSPINWCCCHKSYSAYWWPFCCNDSCHYCGLCSGDSDSSDMIQINLVEDGCGFTSLWCKRCAPCPLPFSLLTCCVYNRIAVSIRDAAILEDLKKYGYPLVANGNDKSEDTPLVGGGGGAQPSPGEQPVV